MGSSSFFCFLRKKYQTVPKAITPMIMKSSVPIPINASLAASASLLLCGVLLSIAGIKREKENWNYETNTFTKAIENFNQFFDVRSSLWKVNEETLHCTSIQSTRSTMNKQKYTERQRLDNGFAWIGELVVVGGTWIAAFIQSVSIDSFFQFHFDSSSGSILSVESPIKEFEYVI